jgi:hypothetical protein
MNNSSLKCYRTSSLVLRPFIPLCIMSQYSGFQLFEITHRETNLHPSPVTSSSPLVLCTFLTHCFLTFQVGPLFHCNAVAGPFHSAVSAHVQSTARYTACKSCNAELLCIPKPAQADCGLCSTVFRAQADWMCRQLLRTSY